MLAAKILLVAAVLNLVMLVSALTSNILLAAF